MMIIVDQIPSETYLLSPSFAFLVLYSLHSVTSDCGERFHKKTVFSGNHDLHVASFLFLVIYEDDYSLSNVLYASALITKKYVRRSEWDYDNIVVHWLLV